MRRCRWLKSWRWFERFDVSDFRRVRAGQAVLQRMTLDGMLATLSELAVKVPDLMRLVLQVCVAALVNVRSVEAVEGELKRRAVVGN